MRSIRGCRPAITCWRSRGRPASAAGRVDEVVELAGLSGGRGHPGRGFLARHGPAPRRSRGAAWPAADRGAGRAGQRPGPGRRALDPAAAQVARRRRADGFRLLAPDERDGADGHPAGGLGRGQLISETSVEDFTGHATAGGILVRTPETARLGQVLAAPGVTVTTDGTDLLRVSGATAEQIGTAAWRAHLPVYELTPTRASLEEAFMQVTRDSIEFHAGATR